MHIPSGTRAGFRSVPHGKRWRTARSKSASPNGPVLRAPLRNVTDHPDVYLVVCLPGPPQAVSCLGANERSDSVAIRVAVVIGIPVPTAQSVGITQQVKPCHKSGLQIEVRQIVCVRAPASFVNPKGLCFLSTLELALVATYNAYNVFWRVSVANIGVRVDDIDVILSRVSAVALTDRLTKVANIVIRVGCGKSRIFPCYDNGTSEGRSAI